MDDNEETLIEDLTFWGRHRFLVLIGLSIVTALMLVGISMTLYVTSGAAQLDLSRPAYKAVSSQAINADAGFENYSAAGKIDTTSVNEFKTLYDKQAAKAKEVDAFGGDPLNPDVLEMSAGTTQ